MGSIEVAAVQCVTERVPARQSKVCVDARHPVVANGMMTDGNVITGGVIVSAIVLTLIAIFGPAIRTWYRSARDKLLAATARRRIEK